MSALTGQTPRSRALALLRAMFREGGVEEAALDARVLLLALTGLSAIDLARDPQAPIGPPAAAALNGAAGRRLAGEPVHRILGEREIWGLPFALGPGTLSPRPDSETLVQAALDHLPDGPARVLDLGTGSGCLLVAILHERPLARGMGVDRCLDAVRTARANALRNGVAERAWFVAGDWAAAVTGPFDLVVSNPPYIPTGDIPALDREVREHDPLAALDGGADGLVAYRIILRDLPRLLSPGASACLEIGAGQGADLTRLADDAGLDLVEIRRDLAGRERVVVMRTR